MIKKLNVIMFLLGVCLFSNKVNAQSEAFKAPVITDEMTVDAEQNKSWRSGQAKFSAKPKNMLEVGLHVGQFAISGDIPTKLLLPGWGAGIHLRKAITYGLSMRLDAMYGVTKGFDDRFKEGNIVTQEQLPSPGSVTNGMYGNFQSKNWYIAFEGIVNIGNILFHNERNKWNLYLGIGAGVGGVQTKVNNQKGNDIYDWSSASVNQDDSYKDNVKKIKDAVGFDDTYETAVKNERGVGTFFDNGELIPQFHGSLGVSRKFGKRFSLSLEQKIILTDYDAWDGFVYRTSLDQTNDNDNGLYTTVRLGINVGSFDKRTEPLYWLNPLDGTLNDIAELKQRPKFDTTDTDGDGVIDMLDQEVNSPTGAAVDTRGIVLDSDKDGIADYKDDEPYSPPGYEVDDRGVSIVPDKPVTQSVLNEALRNAKTDWWLPMIHFDLDKYFIKPEFYPQLKAVADVLIKHPEVKVVVFGNTDVRLANDYNKVLSFNRAKAAIDYLVSTYNIPRDRFVLTYGGEENPIIPDLPAAHNITKQKEIQQYINRRVEFRVATPEDREMNAPTGPDAGKSTPGSSRSGTKYSGNSSSGY